MEIHLINLAPHVTGLVELVMDRHIWIARLVEILLILKLNYHKKDIMSMIICFVRHLVLEERLHKNQQMVIYVYLAMQSVNPVLLQKLIAYHAFQIPTFKMDHVWMLVVLDIMLMIQI